MKKGLAAAASAPGQSSLMAFWGRSTSSAVAPRLPSEPAASGGAVSGDSGKAAADDGLPPPVARAATELLPLRRRLEDTASEHRPEDGGAASGGTHSDVGLKSKSASASSAPEKRARTGDGLRRSSPEKKHASGATTTSSTATTATAQEDGDGDEQSSGSETEEIVSADGGERAAVDDGLPGLPPASSMNPLGQGDDDSSVDDDDGSMQQQQQGSSSRRSSRQRPDRSRSHLVASRTLEHGTRVEVRRGDITAEDVDAVVNAANGDLAHGGGVAGAIRRAGGYRISLESERWVRVHGRVPDGGVAVTGAGDLMCSRVIHAVGPVWRDGQRNEPALLRRATWNSFLCANRLGCATLAIPAISSGIFGFPKPLCASIMLDCAVQFDREVANRDRWQQQAPPTLRCIRFTNFDQQTASIFVNELDRRFPAESPSAVTASSAPSSSSTGGGRRPLDDDRPGDDGDAAAQRRFERFQADNEELGQCAVCRHQLFPGPTPEYNGAQFHPGCWKCPSCGDGLGADPDQWTDPLPSTKQNVLPVCLDCHQRES